MDTQLLDLRSGLRWLRQALAFAAPSALTRTTARALLRTSPMTHACSVMLPMTATILVATASCGGSSGPAVIAGLSVGGTYDTQVSLLPDGNTCGAVQVQNNPTIVDQTPGSGSLSLTHAGNAYPGTVDRTGRFSTPALVVSGRFNISIAGQFSVTGFDATVQVDQLSPPCGYKVHWVGTKSGAPNTFP